MKSKSMAAKAIEHINWVDNNYSQEVTAVRNYFYGPNRKYSIFPKNNNMELKVDNIDSVSALYKYAKGKTAVLNFASYRNPGGKFIDGSTAQEEYLCHKSVLYNVLRNCQSFYDWNESNRNNHLYLNRAIYSENVLFFKPIKADVITCACPNKKAARHYANVTLAENSKALYERIHFILDIAAEHKVETLILGAFGCGVFGQNPYEVAKYFKEYLEGDYKCFNRVIFPIPIGVNDFNNMAFTNILKER